MAVVSWSCWDGKDCIRLRGLGPDREVKVRFSMPDDGVGELPAMAGAVVGDGEDRCFVPRFAFVEGGRYAVVVAGDTVGVLDAPRTIRAATTEVLAIYPSASEVPRNLLRCYVEFSAPMSEGDAARHVRLVDSTGAEMSGALLLSEYELWDGAHRRLTVLLDPARIKRGLVAHREIGYPLELGASFRIVVDEGFRDARGVGLSDASERVYAVGPDERRRVAPAAWTVAAPAAATFEPLGVAFDRPFDRGLLARCLGVLGPEGRPLDGVPRIGPEELSWSFVPRLAWTTGPHRLIVYPVLEDLAGNSLTRVFDRDLSGPTEEPSDRYSSAVEFVPR